MNQIAVTDGNSSMYLQFSSIHFSVRVEIEPIIFDVIANGVNRRLFGSQLSHDFQQAFLAQRGIPDDVRYLRQPHVVVYRAEIGPYRSFD